VLGKNTGLEDSFAWLRNDLDPTVSWSDLDFIRESRNGSLTARAFPTSRTHAPPPNQGPTGSWCPIMASVGWTTSLQLPERRRRSPRQSGIA